MSVPPRYTAVPFPAYRHRLDETPHPTRDPQGHSHGRELVPTNEIALPIVENWQQCVPYLFGCDLYNHGYWWEAHEAWEHLWHVAKAPHEQAVCHLLKGMIQSAACALKLEQGKHAGVQKLTRRVGEYLDAAVESVKTDVLMGLAIPEWSNHLRQYYAEHSSSDARHRSHDMNRFPYIVLLIA